MDIFLKIKIRRLIASTIVVISAISIPFLCYCFYLLVDLFGYSHWKIFFIMKSLSDAFASVFETGIFGMILTFIIIQYLNLIFLVSEKICYTRFGKRYKIGFWIEMIIAVFGVILFVYYFTMYLTDNVAVGQINGGNMDFKLIGVTTMDCFIVSFFYFSIVDDCNYHQLNKKNSWVTEIIGKAKNENQEYDVDFFVVDDRNYLFESPVHVIYEYISSFKDPADMMRVPFTVLMGYIAQGSFFHPIAVILVDWDNNKDTFDFKDPTRELIQYYDQDGKGLVEISRLHDILERNHLDEKLRYVNKIST